MRHASGPTPAIKLSPANPRRQLPSLPSSPPTGRQLAEAAPASRLPCWPCAQVSRISPSGRPCFVSTNGRALAARLLAKPANRRRARARAHLKPDASARSQWLANGSSGRLVGAELRAERVELVDVPPAKAVARWRRPVAGPHATQPVSCAAEGCPRAIA